MASDRDPGFGRVMGGIGLFTLLGTPCVAYLWETLNLLLAGIVVPMRLLISVPVLVVFALILRWMGRVIQRWDAATRSPAPASRPVRS